MCGNIPSGPTGRGVKRNQGDKLKYISLTFIYSTTIAGAGKHILASKSCCPCLYDTHLKRCRATHPISIQCWASVATHCWFNADKLSTTLAQHYSNTGFAINLAAAPQQTRAIYQILFQCWPNVFEAGPTLKQHWVIVPCLLGLQCG